MITLLCYTAQCAGNIGTCMRRGNHFGYLSEMSEMPANLNFNIIMNYIGFRHYDDKFGIYVVLMYKEYLLVY